MRCLPTYQVHASLADPPSTCPRSDEAHAAALRRLAPSHRVRPSLLSPALRASFWALGAAAAVAPRPLSAAVAAGMQDALTDVCNEQLRQLREAGLADAAPEVGKEGGYTSACVACVASPGCSLLQPCLRSCCSCWPAFSSCLALPCNASTSATPAAPAMLTLAGAASCAGDAGRGAGGGGRAACPRCAGAAGKAAAGAVGLQVGPLTQGQGRLFLGLSACAACSGLHTIPACFQPVLFGLPCPSLLCSG